MPAYEYLCESCTSHFELRQKMSDPEVESCPECGGHVRRLISAGAGIISRGESGYSASRSACEPGDACCGNGMGCGAGMCACDA